jgi:DNA-binding NarL/FixJ family response regulator
MQRKTRVIFCGESLVLAGLQAILNQDSSIEVVAQTLPSSASQLCEMQPEVIIYDTNALQPGFRELLAAELPGLLLIGIDPDSHQVTLWSGRRMRELSSRDLVEIIHRETYLDSQE